MDMRRAMLLLMGGSAWTPAKLPGLALWLAADEIAGLSDGDAVATWSDLSGNANHMTQATAGKRPTFQNDAVDLINGRPVVRFDGTDDLLVSPSAFLTATQGAVFAVLKPLRDYNILTLASGDNGSNNRYMDLIAAWDAGHANAMRINQINADAADRVRGSTGLAANTTYMCMWRSSGSAYTLRLNGTNQTIVIDTGANNGDWFGDVAARDNVTVGALQYNSGTELIFAKMDLAELIVTEIAPTERNIAKVEGYLARQYGPFDLVAAFGDSITAGTGATTELARWPNVVATARGWKLLNAGTGGTILQNTAQNSVSTIGAAADNNGRDTYDSRVTPYAPDWVLILYGYNDLRLNDAAITVANFENDLGEVADGIVAAGVSADRIVIGSPPYCPDTYPGPSPWDGGSRVKHAQYVTACANVAISKGTRYVDVFAWMAANGGDALMSGDGIHPNDAGHAQIAAAFMSVL